MEQAAPLKIFTVTRTHKRQNGIFGVFDDEGEPFAVTVESNSLYIPAGEYTCKKSFYNKKKYNTYEVTKVPNRERILIHKGNSAFDDPETEVNESETLGCILVAENFGLLKGRTAILDSKGGFEEFMNRTHGAESFKLVITE